MVYGVHNQMVTTFAFLGHTFVARRPAMTPSQPHSLPFDCPEAFLEGQVMVIDKPLTWTSFDVVNKLRYALRGFTGAKKIKVGHAGTLDPLATGVLVVCCGRATKTIDTLQAQDKVYDATIRLGAHTPSLDAETEVDRWAEDPSAVRALTESIVKEGLAQWVGLIEQKPPLYSAKKVDGQRAYKAARKGRDLALRKAEVQVHNIQFLRMDHLEVDGHPVVDVRVTIECGKGTYIRSLARDIGSTLGVEGSLTSLLRTSSGDFHVDHAWTVDALVAQLAENTQVSGPNP